MALPRQARQAIAAGISHLGMIDRTFGIRTGAPALPGAGLSGDRITPPPEAPDRRAVYDLLTACRGASGGGVSLSLFFDS